MTARVLIPSFSHPRNDKSVTTENRTYAVMIFY